MKKTTIIWAILGLLLVVLLYLLRGNTRLTDIQDWLNNNGLATLFATIIPIWIYLGVYFWNLRKEDTPEYKEHEKRLLNDIHILENVQPFPYRELSLISWWDISWRKRWGDKYTSDLWTAKYTGDSVIVESNLRSSDLWSFLERHLKNSRLQALLNEWESAMSNDLMARKSLFDSIADKVRESIKIPIIQYECEKTYDKPYITYHYVAVIYDFVFCSLSGNPIQDTKACLKHDAQSNTSWNYAGFNWLLLSIDDAKQQDDAVKLLLKLESDLINLPEAQKAKDLYFEAVNKTKQLNTMIKITTSLPRGKRCEYCKKF